MRNLTALLLCCFFSTHLYAQTGDPSRSFYWPKYNNLLNFGNNWLFLTELESLRSFSPDRQRQMLARISLIRQLGTRLQLGLGFAYNRTLNTEAELWEPEWRPHQQIELQLSRNKLRLEQRIRTEQQFIRAADAENKQLKARYSLSLRTRYQFQIVYIPGKEPGEKGGHTAFLRNEVYVLPFGERFFNLNRSSLGMVFQPFVHFGFEAAYMFTILQANPNEYSYRHIAGLTIIHYMD